MYSEQELRKVMAILRDTRFVSNNTFEISGHTVMEIRKAYKVIQSLVSNAYLQYVPRGERLWPEEHTTSPTQLR